MALLVPAQGRRCPPASYAAASHAATSYAAASHAAASYAARHEEGWAEVWQLLGRWLAGNGAPPSACYTPLPRCTASPGQLHRLTTPHPLPGDHANHLHGWDDLHPASPSRQIASIQLSGLSDYTAVGGRQPMRGVSPNAPCRVCFQPGKDVMVPGYPGVMDYPDDEGLPAFAYLFEVSE